MRFQIVFQLLVALSNVPYFALGATITAAPIPLVRRQGGSGSPSCSGFYSAEESCAATTTGFTNLAFDQQASCLCYSSSVWAPSIYDDYVETCVEYLSTASPSFYSSVLGGSTSPTAPCAELAASSNSSGTRTGSAGPLKTSSASYDANAAACTSWDAIAVACSQETSSFNALPFSVEASCLCYSGASYAPSIYDGYWGSCLSFYKTANSTFYSSQLGGDNVAKTPCAAEGNVRGGSSTTGTASSGATPSASASSGPTITSASVQQTASTPPSSMVLTTTEPSATGSSSSGAATFGKVDIAVAASAGLIAFLFVV